jgi:hypothetical protein
VDEKTVCRKFPSTPRIRLSLQGRESIDECMAFVASRQELVTALTCLPEELREAVSQASGNAAELTRMLRIQAAWSRVNGSTSVDVTATFKLEMRHALVWMQPTDRAALGNLGRMMRDCGADKFILPAEIGADVWYVDPPRRYRRATLDIQSEKGGGLLSGYNPLYRPVPGTPLLNQRGRFIGMVTSKAGQEDQEKDKVYVALMKTDVSPGPSVVPAEFRSLNGKKLVSGMAGCFRTRRNFLPDVITGAGVCEDPRACCDELITAPSVVFGLDDETRQVIALLQHFDKSLHMLDAASRWDQAVQMPLALPDPGLCQDVCTVYRDLLDMQTHAADLVEKYGIKKPALAGEKPLEISTGGRFDWKDLKQIEAGNDIKAMLWVINQVLSHQEFTAEIRRVFRVRNDLCQQPCFDFEQLKSRMQRR